MNETPTPRRTPQQWQQLVEQHSSSNLTQKDFCQEHGIRPATFGYWKRKLTAASSVDQDTASSWLDLSALTAAGNPSSNWKIELDLGNGVVLRLSQQ